MSSKLFIGQIPKNMAEDELMSLFQEYGNIVELAIIRDKMTGSHKGCAFLTFTNKEEAEACIEGLHNKHTLQGMANPIQVKFSEKQEKGSDDNRSKNSDNKLFIGMIPKSSTTEEILPVFERFGSIDELSIMKGPDGKSKGCAFLRFTNRESAVQCVTALNGALKLPGAAANLTVKFAESERDKQRTQQVKAQTQMQAQVTALQQIQLLQLANLAAPLLSQSLYAPPQPAWDQYSQPPPPPPGYYPYSYASPYANSTPTPTPAMHSSDPRVLSGQFSAPHQGPTGSIRDGPPGANMFEIYQLPPEYNDVDLYQAFSPFGNIISAKVYVDKETNQSRGFGFVSYDAPEAAQVAVSQMDGFTINGKRLKVQLKLSARIPGRPY